jgi:hypothetical protein
MKTVFLNLGAYGGKESNGLIEFVCARVDGLEQ